MNKKMKERRKEGRKEGRKKEKKKKLYSTTQGLGHVSRKSTVDTLLGLESATENNQASQEAQQTALHSRCQFHSGVTLLGRPGGTNRKQRDIVSWEQPASCAL